MSRSDADDIGSLYVIEIGDALKVGRSRNPRQRLTQHRGQAVRHGVAPGREWISGAGVGCTVNERALIDFCSETGTPRAAAGSRTEYFSDLDFDRVVEYAARLRRRQTSAHPDATRHDPVAMMMAGVMARRMGAEHLLVRAMTAFGEGREEDANELLTRVDTSDPLVADWLSRMAEGAIKAAAF